MCKGTKVDIVKEWEVIGGVPVKAVPGQGFELFIWPKNNMKLKLFRSGRLRPVLNEGNGVDQSVDRIHNLVTLVNKPFIESV